ncbi:MAG: hypothetical protein ACU85U_08065 [Gammaproteobacteria bacterium]|jgi:hypothetical protein
MAKIEQIQIKFVPVEDRLLMRVAGDEGLEFRFWLTRRFVKMIWPALGNAMQLSPTVRTQASPIAQREVLAFEHEKAVSDADFATPYKESPKTLPLGSEPILLSKMQLRRDRGGSLTMSLGPESGPGIDLAINNKLLHSVAELIANGAQLAQWELPPLVAGVAAAPLETPTVN